MTELEAQDPEAEPPQADAEEPPPASSEPAHVEATGPEAADEEGFHPRHPDALRLAMIVGSLVAGLVGLGLVTAATVLSLFLPLAPAGFALIWGAALLLAAIFAFSFVYVPLRQHHRYRYRVDDRGLEIRSGVWWRSHRFIARSRLQHSDVAQGPLERSFGLGNVVVHTAGTQQAATTVTGLSIETARRVRDDLIGELGERDREADGV